MIDLTSHLILHLKLDETSGTTALDASGNELHGTVAGTALWVAGKLGGGFDFDQATRISLGTSNLLNLTAGTIAAWIQLDDFGASNLGRIFDRVAGATGYSFLVNSSGGNDVSFANLANATTYSSERQIQLGKWHHVGVTWSGTALAIFIDGSTAGTFVMSQPVASAPGATAYVGDAGTDNRDFDGRIDDLRVYDRFFSSIDMLALYEFRYPVAPDMPVGQATAPRTNASKYARELTLPAAEVPHAATSVPVLLDIVGDTFIHRDARGDGEDLIITDAIGRPVPHSMSLRRILQRGPLAYSWVAVPVAEHVTADGVDRTFVGYYDLADEAWYIGQWDHLTDAWSVAKLADAPGAQTDDHNNPTVAVGSDGTIYVFATEHATEEIRLWTSNAAYTIASGFTEQTLNLGPGLDEKTYPNCAILTGSPDKIILTWRDGISGTRPRKIAFNTDGGSEEGWGGEHFDLISVTGERPYMHFCLDQANGLMHITWTPDHPSEFAVGDNDLRHAYLRLSDNRLFTTAGVEIGLLGVVSLNAANGTLVESAATEGYNFWTHDIEVDADGHPVILYTENRSVDDIRYKYARWNGAAWVVQELATNNESILARVISPDRSYAGAGSLADGGDELFIARMDQEDVTSIWRWVTADEGATWTSEVVVQGAGTEVIRPVKVRNAHADLQFVYLAGRYDFYSDYLAPDLACWPKCGAECDVRAVFEADTDGASDLQFWLLWGGASFADYRVAPFDGALIASIGDNSNHLLRSPSEHIFNGLEECSLLIAWKPYEVDLSSNPNILLGNWNASANLRQLLVRYDNADSKIGVIFASSADDTLLADATDLPGITNNVRHAVGGRFDAGLVNVFLDGAKSASSASGGGAIDTVASNIQLQVGSSPHAPTLWLKAEVEAIAIFAEAKSDAWFQAATAAMRGDALTVGASNLSLLAGASAVGGFNGGFAR